MIMLVVTVDARRVEQWLAAGLVPEHDRISLLEAVHWGTAKHATTGVEGRAGQRLALLASVEAIARPPGFVLLRASENPPGAV
jgi:hypothetical protein